MKTFFSILFLLVLWISYGTAQDRGIPYLDYYPTAPQNLEYTSQTTLDEIMSTLNWTSLAPSTHAVSRSCCAFITIGGNDFIYQFGGGAGTQYTTVAKYDVAANTWTTAGLAPIPSAMSSASAVTLGNMIYLFGGENTAGLGKTFMYDPVANSWTAKANMLTLVTDALVVKLDENYVYVIGGGTGLFGTGYFNSVQLYNVSANTYTACTNYPVAAGMMGGGMLNYTIVSAGGWDGTAAIANAYQGVVNPGNLTQITWTPIADYPATATTRMASFPVLGGTTYPTAAGVFFSGGAVGGSAVTGLTYFYNICTPGWETLTPNLSLARSNMKACGKMNGEAFVISGYTGTAGTGVSDKATLSAIAGNCYTPVPVELTSFSATVNGKEVILSWITASETNNQGFEVERSISGGEFQILGFVQGNGTTTELQYYSFVDKNLIEGEYIYRLKQVDFDGSFEYSNIVYVEVFSPTVFALDQNYPNPFNPSTKIAFRLAVDSKVSLKIFDVLGQEIASLVNGNFVAGGHSVDFDASTLNSGVYLYRIEATGVDGSNFVDVKKMILTK
jgi:hypothetical protein